MESSLMKWVRPVIISGLAIAVTVGFFMGKLEAEAFGIFATGLIVYWFKSRDNEKEGK